jgi:CheY-like chemotaxis protein
MIWWCCNEQVMSECAGFAGKAAVALARRPVKAEAVATYLRRLGFTAQSEGMAPESQQLLGSSARFADHSLGDLSAPRRKSQSVRYPEDLRVADILHRTEETRLLGSRPRPLSLFEESDRPRVLEVSDAPSCAPASVELVVVDLEGVQLLDLQGLTAELQERFKGSGEGGAKLVGLVRDKEGDIGKRAQELGWAALLEGPVKQDSLYTVVNCVFQGEHTDIVCCSSTCTPGTPKNAEPSSSPKPDGTPTTPTEPSASGQVDAQSAVGVLAGKRVLVVDDAMINRRVASRMLERHGCAAVCAASGQEAIDVYRKYLMDLASPSRGETERFHAILMDVQMPGMVRVSQTLLRIRASPRSEVSFFQQVFQCESEAHGGASDHLSMKQGSQEKAPAIRKNGTGIVGKCPCSPFVQIAITNKGML